MSTRPDRKPAFNLGEVSTFVIFCLQRSANAPLSLVLIWFVGDTAQRRRVDQDFLLFSLHLTSRDLINF